MKKRIAELEGTLAIAQDGGATLQAQLKKEKDAVGALRREVADLTSARDGFESALHEAESREKRDKARLRDAERSLTESNMDVKSALGLQLKESSELKEEVAVARGLAKVRSLPCAAQVSRVECRVFCAMCHVPYAVCRVPCAVCRVPRAQ